MMLTVVSTWMLQLPVAYILSKHTSLGVDGIYWSLPISSVLIFFITVVVFAKSGWRKKRLIGEEEKLMNRVTDEILSDESPR
jgi:Na+-driven multidrug efflux pump